MVYSICNCSPSSCYVVFDYLWMDWWTSAGKELISWMSAFAVFLSHMLSGEGCGISLYRF